MYFGVLTSPSVTAGETWPARAYEPTSVGRLVLSRQVESVWMIAYDPDDSSCHS